MVVEIHASPQPAPVSHESRSYTIEDSSGLDYEILRPIPVVLEKDEDCVVASFNEANIHASGDTFDEAIDNLASYIGDVLDEFLTLGEEVLGAGPRQELAVLSIYIRKRDAE
jgi:predicted RNase H-like HicB family nuclease